MQRRMTILLGALAMVATSCGGGGSESTGETPGSTTTQAQGSTTTTTTTTTTSTTTTTTTTTVPPTPEEALLAAVYEAGLRPDGAEDAALVALANNLCAEAAGADREFFGSGKSPFESSLSVEVYSGSVFPSENQQRLSLEAIRFAALSLETVCPENADVLAASSLEWSNVLDEQTTAAGVCYREIGSTSSYSTVVDCGSPHHGEIVGVVEAGENAVFPAPGGDRSVFDDLFIECEVLIDEYLGSSGGGRISLGYGVMLLVRDQAAWDSGDRRASCSASVRAPLLRASLAGEFDRLSEALAGFAVEVGSCTAEKFEATFTNSSTVDIAAFLRFGSYYPEGGIFYVVLEELAPGESVTRSEEFPEPRDNVREDCDNPLTQVVALP